MLIFLTSFSSFLHTRFCLLFTNTDTRTCSSSRSLVICSVHPSLFFFFHQARIVCIYLKRDISHRLHTVFKYLQSKIWTRWARYMSTCTWKWGVKVLHALRPVPPTYDIFLYKSQRWWCLIAKFSHSPFRWISKLSFRPRCTVMQRKFLFAPHKTKWLELDRLQVLVS